MVEAKRGPGEAKPGFEIERLVRDLIVPGVGNRRIFRILLSDACRFACDFCPMRAQRQLPRHAMEPTRLAKTFIVAYRRGWCDGLFITTGLPKSPIFAMEKLLQLVEIVRQKLGYRGYIHAKVTAGADPSQVERLVRLADRVSYNLEPACTRALAQETEGQTVGGPALDVVPEGPPPRRPRTVGLSNLRDHRLNQADHLLREYGFSATELAVDRPGGLPLEADPKLTWAVGHPERFPVELMTAPWKEICRVPGIGPRSANRILELRRRGMLGKLSDLDRLGAALSRCLGFATLNGRILGARPRQAGLFEAEKPFAVRGYKEDRTVLR